MRVALTGTPGTGKTTVASHLETDLDVIDLNRLVEDEDLTAGEDAKRDSWIADLTALRNHLAGRDDVVFESHLAHHLPVDRVVVLRCHPVELERRLRERGASVEKAAENADAEALDVVLAEAVAEHGEGAVYELDTTDRSPDAVAREVEAVLRNERAPAVGIVDFVEYLEP